MDPDLRKRVDKEAENILSSQTSATDLLWVKDSDLFVCLGDSLANEEAETDRLLMFHDFHMYKNKSFNLWRKVSDAS